MGSEVAYFYKIIKHFQCIRISVKPHSPQFKYMKQNMTSTAQVTFGRLQLGGPLTS